MDSSKLEQLLASLRQREIQIWLEGPDLRYRSPAGALTPELLSQLKQQKPAVIDFLRKAAAATANQAAIKPRTQHLNLPLSFAQQRLWFLDLLQPNSVAYNIPLALRLKGNLNVQALRESLGEIVRRHEALRTSIKTVEGVPFQVIEPAVPFELPLADLSDMPDEQRKLESKRLCFEEAKLPFDLTRGPMLRAKLFRLGPAEHVFFLMMHHIASDGWSMGLLYGEMKVLYQAFCAGQPSSLPELPVQYADYALWQRDWLRGAVLDQQIEYWKKKLADIPASLDLPTDRPREIVQSYRGTILSQEFPKNLLPALLDLSRQSGASLFMTLLAALQTLLFRYTGQEDVAVGSAIAGRNKREVEKLIGFFVNTLVMRGDLTGNPSFRTLLARTRATALEAYAHQDIPFEKLVESLHPDRDTSRSPFFQVVLSLQNTPRESLQLTGLETTPIPIDSDAAKIDLTIYAKEDGDTLKISFEYNTDLFEADTMRRMLGHYRTLLENVARDPGLEISRLGILTSEERQQLSEWNRTQSELLSKRCIHELIEGWAGRTPTAVAVYFGGERMTYGELEQSANRLARHLQELGVGPESLVGLSVDRSLEMVVGILGILKAGGAYVPMDPEYPRDRLSYMLADAQPKVLVTQSKYVANFVTPGIQVVQLDADWGAISQLSGERVESGVNDRNLAYMIYTSGSTGRPKGVLLEHRGLCNLVEVERTVLEIGPESRVLQFASLSFDASVFEIFGALAAGASLVLGRREELLPGAEFGQMLREQGVSVATLPPTVLHAMSEEGLPALKTVVSAGEACTLELAKRWGRGRRFINAYGPTETTVCATMEVIGAEETKVTIGRPIPNTQLYLLDQHLQEVPVGVVGELHVGGMGLARGYHNRAEMTAEKFIANPFEVGARLYKTGDLGRYLPDGRVEYLGRVDHQVKIRGFRIELGEIEAQLSSHPMVREAVVVAWDEAGNGKYLAGYVVLKEGQTAEVADLRKALAASLPEYMIPSAWGIMDKFPLTPNGKIDRKALPRPDLTLAMPGKGDYAPPTSATEKLMAEIWAEVLGIQQISVTHTFFELGGHSLLMVKLQAKLSEKLKRNIPIVELFQFPTINLFARHLDNGNSVQNNVNSMVNAKDRANRQKQALAQQIKKIKK